MKPIRPRLCVGCRADAETAVNGADLCRDCEDLAETNGGGEAGLGALMRYGPEMLRKLA